MTPQHILHTAFTVYCYKAPRDHLRTKGVLNMNRIFIAFAAMLVVALAFVGCRSSGDSGDSSACGSEACGGGSDMAEMMINMYLDGTQKASPWVAMHSVVHVGQLWEVTSNFGGQQSVNKWQVSSKAPGTKSEFIVENDMGQGYIIAYQVDAWAEVGKPNVSKAWIGKPGEEPQEIEIMEWKPATDGETAKPNGIVLTEEYSNLEMAGGTFEGDLTTVKADGNTTKTWMADNGWFNKLIKMESNGDVVMELTGYDFNEKPDTWLKWQEDE